jgi:hypothetical protein
MQSLFSRGSPIYGDHGHGLMVDWLRSSGQYVVCNLIGCPCIQEEGAN